MACAKIFLTAYLTLIAFASGRTVENKYTTLFPHGKTLVYDYFGEVKAELTESPKSISQYFIRGKFYITHYTENPNLRNAYIVTLQNATTGYSNENESFEKTPVSMPTPQALQVLQGPFGVILKESGALESVTISENEPIWSKNIKFAWASLLQLNIKDINFELPVTTQSFVVPENTIYGRCKTSYDVHAKYPASNNSKTFLVTKFTSPMECSEYKPFSFDFVDVKLCFLPEEELLNTASTKIYDMEVDNSNNLLVRKIFTHGEINFFPFYHDSEAYIVQHNGTFTFDGMRPSSEYVGPTIDFDSIPSTYYWSYQRTNNHYAENAALDITNGRRVVNQDDLVNEVQKMLIDAANYLKDNHIKTEEPNWQRSKIIDNIRETLSYLEIASFNKIFSRIQNDTTPNKKAIKSLFSNIVSQVGTTAANLFAFEIIKSKNVTDFEAVEILGKLPFHVRVPSENLLSQWESFAKSCEALSPEVYKASILATGTMVYRTFPYVFNDNPIVQRHLEYAYQRVLNEPTYEMKVVWLGVIHNIQVGNICKVLAPILSGEIELSERPDYIRLLSIGAMLRSLYLDYDRAINLLWPVMANSSLPLKLRIGSYNILLQQSRSMTDFLRIHWFMVNERNEHLLNFHWTTLKGFAESHCPCFAKMREYSTKVLEFTPAPSSVPQNLTALYVIDTMNDKGDGMQLKITVVRDQITNVPEIVYLQQFIMQNHKVTSYWALYIQSDGMDNMLKNLNNDFLYFFEGPITETFIFYFIRKVATAITLSPESFVDVLLFYRDQAVMINYYNQQSLKNLDNDIKQLIEHHNNLDSYHVFYQNIFDEYVISDLGVPVVFGTHSPAVISWQMETNDHDTTKDLSLNVSAKVWLFHDYFISVYNPIDDIWQSAEQLSIVNTDSAFQFTVKYSPRHRLLRYFDTRDWSIKFIEANVSIRNRGVASIENNNNNNNILRTGDSIYSHEEIVPSAISNLRNSSPITFTDGGKQYEVTLFNCENQSSNVTNQDYIKVLPRLENHDFIIFPLSSQIKNCGNVIKIKPNL